MKGYSYPGTSPVTDKGEHNHPHKKEKVITSIDKVDGKRILTRTKGNRSATFSEDLAYRKKTGGKGTKWRNTENPEASFITTT